MDKASFASIAVTFVSVLQSLWMEAMIAIERIACDTNQISVMRRTDEYGPEFDLDCG